MLILAFLMNIMLLGNGFVLMSSIPLSYQEFSLFSNPVKYNLDTTVLLNDLNENSKDVGYKIKTGLIVKSIWTNDNTQHLLKFELQSPKLLIRRKSAAAEQFVPHKSHLDTYKQTPFFALWRNGYIDNVYLHSSDDISYQNYKKGIISLFQINIFDGDYIETDVSGTCLVTYTTHSQTVIYKYKTNCTLPKIEQRKNNINHILSPKLNNKRQTTIKFTDSFNAIDTIMSEEEHLMMLHVKRDVGNTVRVVQSLIRQSDGIESESVKGTTMFEALQHAEEKYSFIMKGQDLTLVKDKKNGVQNLLKVLKEHKKSLYTEKLGTEEAATAFSKVLDVMRQSSTDDIMKAFKSIKNEHNLQQLCDLLGFTQTLSSHQAAKQFLQFDNIYDEYNIERYLQALALGHSPNVNVILDLLNMSNDKKLSDKLSETLILTVSSMAHNYVRIADVESGLKMSNKVKDTISHGLSRCKDQACFSKYMRALRNLKNQDTVELLIDHIRKGSSTVSVLAFSALRSIPRVYWGDSVLEIARKVFYQLDKKYDSSARIIALDVLFKFEPCDKELRYIIKHLASNDKEHEVKQHLLQTLQMYCDKCDVFRGRVMRILADESQVHNWHVFAMKGLSTALTRSAGSNEWSNMTIVSEQEINSGLLKRGTININLQTNDDSKEIFSLGMYASGLSSIVGSSDQENSEEAPVEEQTSTAGLEINVMGVGFRPLVLFEGSGELMGHVWSGTASDRTSAYQANLLIEDSEIDICLSSGNIVELRLRGTASIDLAGQIQISLWNRVAHTLIDNIWSSLDTNGEFVVEANTLSNKGAANFVETAAVSLNGAMKLDDSIVKASVEFDLKMSPRLESESDVDFYNKVAICVQVRQPDFVIRHEVKKFESVKQTKHILRRTRSRAYTVPGKTFALNRKNNDMCNMISKKN